MCACIAMFVSVLLCLLFSSYFCQHCNLLAFENNYLNSWLVIFHGSFDLHFSSNWWSWAYLHIIVCVLWKNICSGPLSLMFLILRCVSLFFILCIWLFYLNVSALWVCLEPMRSEKSCRTPWTTVTDICKPACGWWDPYSGAMQEQQLLLTTEPSLQPLHKFFMHFCKLVPHHTFDLQTCDPILQILFCLDRSCQ